MRVDYAVLLNTKRRNTTIDMRKTLAKLEERGYTILGVDYKQKMRRMKKSLKLTFFRLYEYYGL